MRKELRKLYLQKANRFRKQIQENILGASIDMTAEAWACGEAVPWADRLKGTYEEVKPAQPFGKIWEYAWLRLKAQLPADWQNTPLALSLDIDREACIFDTEGCPHYGLTIGSIFNPHYSKTTFPVPSSWVQDGQIEIWAEAAASHWMGADHAMRINHMRVHKFNDTAWQLWLDIDVLLNLCERLPETSVRRQRILRALHEAGNTYARNHEALDQSREILKPEFDKPACASSLTTYAVGHAHIDTGWLWPVSTTHGKIRRTFASQIDLIEKYPDYVFGASQPQHYAMLKEQYPALYEKVKKHVASGQWELQGAMWVESDCNVTSGESLVRQVLHGKNFFMDEFGIDVQNLWLPDVFGYSAAMPQILQKAGVNTFLTQKISWSQFNTFPHHTFLWRGIDGTEILTHFPPEDNYNSMLEPSSILKASDRFTESDRVDAFATLFGMGDGGGGPKEEVIERGLRQRDLEGTPRVKFAPAQELFDYLHTCEDILETWDGELYLELHRGTLTTQSKVKQGNRQLENRLREIEFFCSLLPLEDYPIDTLDALWKKLLINQFHDILPGSSVPEVYRDTLAEYRQMNKTCNEIIETAAAKIFTPDDNTITCFNTLSCPYTSTIQLPEGWTGAAMDDGTPLTVQQSANGTIATVHIPPLGLITLTRAEGPVPEPQEVTEKLILENQVIRYEFSEDATLIRGYDKETGREILPATKTANILSLYEDVPQNWEAWDIDIYYEEQRIETAHVETADFFDGPVYQTLRFSMHIGNSTILQNIRLENNTRRLDFHTTVEWNEQRKMLRAAFPVNIQATDASFDIQFGYTRRPTHRNTSWDMAKFEVAAHKYIDLSEPDYGVALLNDSRYGHKVHDNVLDLHLLRSPHYPDEGRTKAYTDAGTHTLTYSLLPHIGDLPHSDVQSQAWILNRRPLRIDGYRADDALDPVRIESEGVVLETFKKAEKEACHVIRLVENAGRHSKATLYLKGKNQLQSTDLMEWQDGETVTVDGSIEISLKPFEIRTYKIS